MSRIDDAVSRILRMKERLGLYKHPTQRLKDYPKFGVESILRHVSSMILICTKALECILIALIDRSTSKSKEECIR